MTTFSSVITLSTMRTSDPASAGIDRFVGLEHIEPENLHIRSWGLVADGTTFTNTFKSGQVLFGKRRAYQRKVAVADFDGVCSSDIYVFESKDPNVLLPELVPFILQSEGFYEYAVKTSAGSLSPRTNWTHLANYELNLPPVDEQRRIADLLWAADDSISRYNDLLTNADKLTLSTSAHLTRLANFDEHNINQIELPSGWEYKRIGEVCILGGGYGFRPKDWSEKGLPIIRIQNLNGSTEFNYFSGEPEPEWLVQPGTLLFAWAGMPGVSFGPCLWSGPVGVLNQHIYRITPKEGYSVVWLYHVLKLLTPWIEKRAHGFKTSLLHIRQKELTERIIPVPPEKVQQEIAKKLLQCETSRNEIASHLINTKNLKAKLLESSLM